MSASAASLATKSCPEQPDTPNTSPDALGCVLPLVMTKDSVCPPSLSEASMGAPTGAPKREPSFTRRTWPEGRKGASFLLATSTLALQVTVEPSAVAVTVTRCSG